MVGLLKVLLIEAQEQDERRRAALEKLESQGNGLETKTAIGIFLKKRNDFHCIVLLEKAALAAGYWIQGVSESALRISLSKAEYDSPKVFNWSPQFNAADSQRLATDLTINFRWNENSVTAWKNLRHGMLRKIECEEKFENYGHDKGWALRWAILKIAAQLPPAK